jgi:putative membrane protein
MAPAALRIVLTAWNLNPTLVLGFMALGGGYLYAIGPLRRRHGWAAAVPRWQVAAFLAGVAVLAFALISPLDALGDEYLFSAHMVQHMLLTLVFPPLLLVGTPAWLLRLLLRRPRVLWIARGLTWPAVAFALFNGDFWLWHLPALYDLTLRNEAVHVLEHLTFMATATLSWFPILSPAPDKLPRLTPPLQLLYLFLSCQPMVVLGALLTFASQPLYTPYLAAPRLWGLSALVDQQLGGLIMWIPGSLIYILVMSVVFFVWIERQSEAEARAVDAALGFSDAEAGAVVHQNDSWSGEAQTESAGSQRQATTPEGQQSHS